MQQSKFVIAGGGMVAGYAAKQMVELGLKPGELIIISADNSIPYERPPLSKGYLAGKDTDESVQISPEDFYRTHGIEVRLETEVSSVDAAQKRLRMKSGAEIGFEKLLVATGARPRTLDIPGAQLGNVHYLRSLSDSKSIRESVEGVGRAVVIGSGFIGMEVAAVLAQKGIEVTMVLREDRIWKQFFTPRMSSFFEDYYSARGVRFLKQATLTELSGDTSVKSATLADGQTIPCELIVAGIGVQPVTELLAGSGIEAGNGVMVNEFLETNKDGIYAAGDVANYPDLIFGKRRRVEHWDNAVSQGQHCGKTLMGERSEFRHVPYFFSDVFDLSYEFWGDPSDSDQTAHRGDFANNSFSVWWLRAGVVVAAFVMSRPDEEREIAPKWIEARQKVSATELEQGTGSVLFALAK